MVCFELYSTTESNTVLNVFKASASKTTGCRRVVHLSETFRFRKSFFFLENHLDIIQSLLSCAFSWPLTSLCRPLWKLTRRRRRRMRIQRRPRAVTVVSIIFFPPRSIRSEKNLPNRRANSCSVTLALRYLRSAWWEGFCLCAVVPVIDW